MLVLTRRLGESVCVGDGFVLTVIAVQGKKVRLGIEAPAAVRVDRQEVRRRMQPVSAEPRLSCA